MAEENVKKKGAIGETPEIERPPVLKPEEPAETPTPPTPPSPAFEESPANPEKSLCQWFLSDTNFCDKIKKNVRCDGNTSKCPF